MTALRLRTRINFPASVTANGGIAVDKQAGVWIVHPQFSDLQVLLPANVPDPSTQQIWIYNPATNSYAVLTLLGLSQALYTMHSTSAVLIGTGAKTFAVEQNKDIGVGQNVIMTSNANPTTNFMVGIVSGYSGGTLNVISQTAGGAGTFSDWTIRAAGTAGPTGATGAAGADAGVRYLFNTATIGDPGSGLYRFNDPTFANVTALAISKTDADTNGLAALLATLDDSASAMKCLVVFTKIGNPNALAIGYISGTLTDLGTYDTFPFTPVVAVSGFINNENTRAQFFRVGDRGTDGTGAPQNPTGTIGLAAVNGVATGFIRSDGSPPLSQAIAPTWSALHAFTLAPSFNGGLNSFGGMVNNQMVTPVYRWRDTAGGADQKIWDAYATGGSFIFRSDDDAGTGFTTYWTALRGALNAAGRIEYAVQTMTPVAVLTDAANIVWTVNAAQKAKVTLGGNRTMNAVTGAVEGATYSLWVIQDATGTRTITWTTTGAGSFDFGTVGAPILTTTVSRADLLTFEAISIAGTLKLRFTGIMRGFA